MQKRPQVEQESTLAELIRAVVIFRANHPSAGTAKMVDWCDDLLDIYSRLGSIPLESEAARREKTVAFLHQIGAIVRLTKASNWNSLARNKLLYPEGEASSPS